MPDVSPNLCSKNDESVKFIKETRDDLKKIVEKIVAVKSAEQILKDER